MHVLTQDVTVELLQGMTTEQLTEQTKWQFEMWQWKANRCSALDAAIVALPTDTCDAEIEVLGGMLKDEKAGLTLYHVALQLCYTEQANRTRVRQEEDREMPTEPEMETAHKIYQLTVAAAILHGMNLPDTGRFLDCLARNLANAPSEDVAHIYGIHVQERTREQCAYDGD